MLSKVQNFITIIRIILKQIESTFVLADVGEEKIIISITCLLMLGYTQICPASNLHIGHCLLLLQTKEIL